MSKKKKAIFVSLLSFGLLVLIVLGVLFGYSYSLYSKMKKEEVNKEYILEDVDINYVNEKTSLEEEEGINNILLLGRDAVGLSDCIMVLTVKEKTKEIKLCSIMRDSWVEVPNYGEAIINWAVNIGGPECTLKTINNNFGLKLDKYIELDLTDLPKIIDKIGGLDFEITEDEVKIINAYINSINEMAKTKEPHIERAGYQHFTGVQATAYCRIRYTEGNDFKRTERQRFIIEKIFNKISGLSVSEISNLMDYILPLVGTNLSYTEVVDISKNILSIGINKVSKNRFPNDGDHWSTWDYNDYQLRFDKKITSEKINEFIYGK